MVVCMLQPLHRWLTKLMTIETIQIGRTLQRQLQENRTVFDYNSINGKNFLIIVYLLFSTFLSSSQRYSLYYDAPNVILCYELYTFANIVSKREVCGVYVESVYVFIKRKNKGINIHTLFHYFMFTDFVSCQGNFFCFLRLSSFLGRLTFIIFKRFIFAQQYLYCISQDSTRRNELER